MKIEFQTNREVRANKFLAEKLPFLKRTFVQKLFRKKEIKLGKVAQKPDSKIQVGETLAIFLPDPRKYFFELTGNKIVFEDRDVIAFDKRSGLATHLGVGTKNDNLRDCAETLLGLRLIVVHRLDRGTSGLVVFAKNQKMARQLENEFRERKVFKKYFALVTKIPREKSGEVNLDLKKVGAKMEIVKQGLPAQTFWQVVKTFKNSALLAVEIKTGRTHQIRAHLAAIGLPILGDSLYGVGEKSRLFLHAAELRILNYNFTSAVPAEFYEN
ncbi:MAG: RluA family pseudouridine synthase [Patescibacteria group bacterium]